MADDKRKTLREEKEIIQEQINLTNALTKAAQNNVRISEKGVSLRDELIKKLNEEKDVGSKIEDIQETIRDLIKEQVEKGTDVNQGYIEQLDNTRKLLEQEKAISEAKDEFTDKLKDAAGMNNEFVKAFQQGGAIGLGIVAATKALEFFEGVLSNTVGLAKELYTSMGTTASEAARLGAQTLAASFSIEGLLYGTEGIANAAKEAGEFFATTRNITGDMQKTSQS